MAFPSFVGGSATISSLIWDADLKPTAPYKIEATNGYQIGDIKFLTDIADGTNGWIYADGRALKKTEYPELYNIIGDIVVFDAGHYPREAEADEFLIPQLNGNTTGTITEPIYGSNIDLGKITAKGNLCGSYQPGTSAYRSMCVSRPPGYIGRWCIKAK